MWKKTRSDKELMVGISISTSAIAALDISARDKAVANIQLQGLSVRQINRLTDMHWNHPEMNTKRTVPNDAGFIQI